jgi:hypothetical protein
VLQGFFKCYAHDRDGVELKLKGRRLRITCLITHLPVKLNRPKDFTGKPTNRELTNGRAEIISVVVRLCEDFVAKAKASRFDYDFGLRKKIPTILVRSESGNDRYGDGSTLRIAIARKDFATFDKGKIPIQFCLEDSLMFCRIGPVKMVTYREDDMSRLLIRAYHVTRSGCSTDTCHPQGKSRTRILAQF